MLLVLVCTAVLTVAKCPLGFADHGDAEKCANSSEPWLQDAHYGETPDPGTTTVQGCECDSACGATVDFGNANCDWCYTKNKCGHYAVTRFAYYDYCVYPEIDESADYTTKEVNLWSKVTEDTGLGNYPTFAGIFGESIQTTFDDQWDYMPNTRQKYIHSVGVVCLMNMEVSSNKYTGILKQGTQQGFIRMGSALKPGSVEIASNAIVPGNGFKFMRTGAKSANWVSLYTLAGQKDSNFFLNNQSNHIPPPSGVQNSIAVKFDQVSNCITMVGLSDAAKIDQDGNVVGNPQFPYQLIFAPTDEARATMPMNGPELSLTEVMQYMNKISAQTPLFDVYAKPAPGSPEEYFGRITTTSDCTTSLYGDGKFFIRHQRMEEDLQLRPEWPSMMDAQTECGTKTVNPVPPKNCSHEEE